MQIAFTKMHGLGNDFIVVEEPCDISYVKNHCVKMCDRHFGIGADGILVLNTENPSMKILNSDGSSAEMCGNGLRCAAVYFFEKYKKNSFTVHTDAGPYHVETDGKIVTVAMLPCNEFREDILTYQGKEYPYYFVRVGNPHAVIFSEYLYEQILQCGPIIEQIISGGLNVNCVREKNGIYHVSTWERGAGKTLACGTGAYSSALSIFYKNSGIASVLLRLPGGQIEFVKKADIVYMHGPAEKVFEGVYYET